MAILPIEKKKAHSKAFHLKPRRQLTKLILPGVFPIGCPEVSTSSDSNQSTSTRRSLSQEMKDLQQERCSPRSSLVSVKSIDKLRFRPRPYTAKQPCDGEIKTILPSLSFDDVSLVSEPYDSEEPPMSPTCHQDFSLNFTPTPSKARPTSNQPMDVASFHSPDAVYLDFCLPPPCQRRKRDDYFEISADDAKQILLPDF
eukprot:CAMPEP_0194048258 /NCGR_PEP_ID=MMETSP0009_2-20130614/26819_1 /TAXON_ID=210454 /ORGANISM="Grammatophora oceanica, Strain CCMP 410" /LENGTH=198 /DNA_ID=CAMNT_0038694081 /DNA_START=80 /DNA_END=676 /DNA_ORIENTATION=+